MRTANESASRARRQELARHGGLLGGGGGGGWGAVGPVGPGPVVEAPGGVGGDLELGGVERGHGVEGHDAGLAGAEVEEGELEGGGPGEGEVPGVSGPLGLVDRREAGGGVLEGLPAAEVVDAANGDGHAAAQELEVGLGDVLDRVVDGARETRVDHVGLEDGALHVDAVLDHGVVQLGLDGRVDREGGLEVVASFERDVGLDYGHEALGLRDERVSREVAHVGLYGEARRSPARDVDLEGGPPLGELAAPRRVLGEADVERVEALHHRVAARSRQREHLEVRLAAGGDAEGLQLLREQDALVVLLEYCLGVEDRGREVLVGALSLEEHLSVDAAVLLRVLHADRLKPRPNRPRPLVARRDPFARSRDARRNLFQPRLLLGAQEGPSVRPRHRLPRPRRLQCPHERRRPAEPQQHDDEPRHHGLACVRHTAGWWRS
mmetsp:Transcript_18304/g.57568  ORF Transcript_18304/g.57568 Transcript_18304/m.57568 type:complete len:436 (+) Transcript_18304:184-1491(+)